VTQLEQSMEGSMSFGEVRAIRCVPRKGPNGGLGSLSLEPREWRERRAIQRPSPTDYGTPCTALVGDRSLFTPSFRVGLVLIQVSLSFSRIEICREVLERALQVLAVVGVCLASVEPSILRFDKMMTSKSLTGLVVYVPMGSTVKKNAKQIQTLVTSNGGVWTSTFTDKVRDLAVLRLIRYHFHYRSSICKGFYHVFFVYKATIPPTKPPELTFCCCCPTFCWPAASDRLPT
jgi:hypothetical protein